VENTSEIVYVLNSMVMFVTIFFHCYYENLSEESLVTLGVFIMIFGYLIYLGIAEGDHSLITTIKTTVILVGTLFILVPVMSSINKNYANDTLSVMILIFSFLHIALYDYDFVLPEEELKIAVGEDEVEMGKKK